MYPVSQTEVDLYMIPMSLHVASENEFYGFSIQNQKKSKLIILSCTLLVVLLFFSVKLCYLVRLCSKLSTFNTTERASA